MSLSLKFDPKTIEHLGVKMYSTLPPALAELISNSYDADASEVTIEFLEQNGTPKAITIEDNGTGMSLKDIQEKFLVIGRNRRMDEGDNPSSRYGRLPTGKKGLGKLALFGLAKEISVDTTKEGLRNRFHLNWNDLLASSDTYNPKIDITDREVSQKSKTIIQLSDLKRRSPFDLEAIADSLSRIFIVDSNFIIKLKNGKGHEITISDDRRYSNITPEFIWNEDDLVTADNAYYGKVKLFLATGKTPIPPSSGLRGIALFSRGKLVNAPEYFSESTSSHFYQYLTGWIKADFIDLLDEDVISTNRQALNWDQPEMSNFRAFLSEIIANVGQDWRKRRANKKDDDIKKVTGIDKKHWFSTLPDDVRTSVEAIVKKMGDSEEVSETFAPVVQALYAIIPEYPLLHWRHLHKSIKDGVLEYYKNGQYGHAADQGAKLYANQIKKLSAQDVDGSALANVFSYDYETKTKTVTRKPIIPVNDLSTDSLRNIQQGQSHLTRGLMEGFRNPINHAPMSAVVPNLISELDCLNVLSLVSYLAAKLDYSEELDKT
ncbi:MAG: TIGR02391 family protein [Burkholderiales bacterium RIFOXYC12_FULL_60_6]|nr:MAG: TIGR02391 family protein [Burkholderiales bacterium RIFOXYD12_FULL_59_19]OGB79152.1 MAG: TIGR02391 family protein [Burkholderiales bacterium RIFOXYC12_FULL_60_6]